MDVDPDAELLAVAREMVAESHAPYSEYRVGAAVRTADGTVYRGCNLEVVNFSNSLHAEEVALAAALRDGHRSFDALAVSSAARDGITPCGMCRQTLAEFCEASLPVTCEGSDGDDPRAYTLGELLPAAMGPETLE